MFGLNQLLSWFGFDGAFCEDKDGTWSPVRGQISVGGTVSLGWSVAGLWAQLDGRMQYLNAADNPLCNTLGQYNTWWGCQDFCNWQSGDGVPTAMAGELSSACASILAMLACLLWLGDQQLQALQLFCRAEQAPGRSRCCRMGLSVLGRL